MSILTCISKKKRKRFSIHYLVASTFIDGEQENLEINHKDGNKLNNCYLNLEWVTRSENQQHQRKMYNTYRSCFYCKNCGKEITKNSCLCLSCFHDLQRSKIIHPTKAELEKDIKTMSIVKIGKKYNLSDNGIRKKMYKIWNHYLINL